MTKPKPKLIPKLTPKLTLGPLSYHWDAEKRRDFYFRIADEAPIDEVYLGEVVCSKREPFFEPYRNEVINRLQKAGKKVHFSTLAVMTLPRECEALSAMVQGDHWIEVNDVAAIQLLKGAPFIVGPHIMVLNEGVLAYLETKGARRVVFASEMRGKAMAFMAAQCPKIEKEAQVFGHQSLALSMRCYHARSEGRNKDHCLFACGEGDGALAVKTLDEQPIWTIAGTQTLSSGTLVLAAEALALQAAGVTHFRLAPQDIDMVAVARLYRDLLESRIAPDSLVSALKKLDESLSPINGFYHGKEGREFIL